VFAVIRLTARLAPILLLILIITLLMALAQALALTAKSPLHRTLPVVWHRIICRLMRIRVTTHGTPATGRPLLIVANHVSWSDISVLGTVMPVSFVAKSEMKDWPVFGWLAKLQRSVFVNRNVRHETGLQVREIADRLSKDDDVIVLFAEGTTSDGTRLLPFKSSLIGAAKLAMGEAGSAIVQPVAIAYTRYGGLPMGFSRRINNAWIGDLELLPHLKLILSGRPLDVDILFGKPIVLFNSVDRRAVTQACEASVSMMLKQALSNTVETAHLNTVQESALKP
jgi:lyso-ornithine lipid O-acyltransferase